VRVAQEHGTGGLSLFFDHEFPHSRDVLEDALVSFVSHLEIAAARQSACAFNVAVAMFIRDL
jgi:hypothetical protein